MRMRMNSWRGIGNRRTDGRGGRKTGKRCGDDIHWWVYLISFIIKTTPGVGSYSSCTEEEIVSQGSSNLCKVTGVTQQRWDSNEAFPFNCSCLSLCHTWSWYAWTPPEGWGGLQVSCQENQQEDSRNGKRQEALLLGLGSGLFQLSIWFGGRIGLDCQISGIQFKVIV